VSTLCMIVGLMLIKYLVVGQTEQREKLGFRVLVNDECHSFRR